MLLGIIIGIVKLLCVVIILSVYVMYATWYERKIIGHMQQRIGPKRVGPYGLLQPIADAIKSFFKEDIIPKKADKTMFWLAPLIAVTFPFAAAIAIPFFPPLMLSSGKVFHFAVFTSNIGVLYILAMFGITSFGVLSAGAATGGSKYVYIGSQREIAQLVSYEVILSLAVLNPVLMAHSLNLDQIVKAQSHLWFVFYQPIAFVAYVIAMIAASARVPFDLPEAEPELVAGFNTEFSGMKMAMFFFGQYVTMFVFSALGALVFLGGWTGPILPGFIWYWIKIFVFIFMFTAFWGTFPRYRYDQLMNIAWKLLLPLMILNILWTGFALSIGLPYFH